MTKTNISLYLLLLSILSSAAAAAMPSCGDSVMEEDEGHGFEMLQLKSKALQSSPSQYGKERAGLDAQLGSFSSSWISASSEASESSGMWQHHFVGFRKSHSATSACGVVIAAFGDANSTYVQQALDTIQLFKAESVRPGWCKAAPDLTEIPVTLNTNLPPDQLAGLLIDVNQGSKQVSGMSTSKFDYLDEGQNLNTSIKPKLGPAIYRWYHCQIFVHAPYDLMLYMDADTTICTASGVAELFRDGQENDWDLAFEESTWLGGCGMTDGNCTSPHPPSVKSDADLDSWSNFKEPNDGVVLFAASKPPAQKFANGFCDHLKESFQMEVRGDQYAFRSSLWESRNTLKTQSFPEGLHLDHKNLTTNRVCRYNFKSKEHACSHGCNVVHASYLLDQKESNNL